MSSYTRLLRRTLLPVLALPAFAFAADPLTPQAPISIPNSKGGFDFLEVDAAQSRLLLDHTGNGTLDVIDVKAGKLLKQIPTGAAMGVAVDEKAGRYYVSVSKEKKMVIIDSRTLEKTGEVALPGPADGLVFASKHNRVFVTHDDEKEVWSIDPVAKKIEATVAIGAGPEYGIYDAAGDRIFLNIKTTDSLMVIDPATNKVTATWPTGDAKHPHGLAFDAKAGRLYVAGNNGKLAILSATDGKILGSVDTVTGVDQIALDAGNGRIYCPSGSGSMTVVQTSADGAKALGNVTTAKGAKTVAVDPATHAVWIAYAEGSGCFARKFTP